MIEAQLGRSAGVLFAAILALVARAPADAQLPPAGAPPYITTPAVIVEAMLEMGRVTADDVVYDLGSGDGRIVIEAANRGARGVGVEYEEWLVALSRARADSAGVSDRVRFDHGDLFDADLTPASVVMLYLGADFNLRLRPRLFDKLEAGSRVVSHAFHMGDWAPDEERTIGTGAGRATLFAWTIPADVDGFWSLRINGGDARSLDINQRFQEIEGAIRTEQGERSAFKGTVTGRTINFTVARAEGDVVYSGRLADGRIVGTVTSGAETGEWSAERFSAMSAVTSAPAAVGVLPAPRRDRQRPGVCTRSSERPVGVD